MIFHAARDRVGSDCDKPDIIGLDLREVTEEIIDIELGKRMGYWAKRSRFRATSLRNLETYGVVG
jgi:hypothetical protein